MFSCSSWKSSSKSSQLVFTSCAFSIIAVCSANKLFSLFDFKKSLPISNREIFVSFSKRLAFLLMFLKSIFCSDEDTKLLLLSLISENCLVLVSLRLGKLFIFPKFSNDFILFGLANKVKLPKSSSSLGFPIFSDFLLGSTDFDRLL